MSISEVKRKAIPSAISRQLRQEAGFGCCKCGAPIIQYHHILQWSKEQHNRAEDMMVLCPTHHDQVTKGAMPEKEQRALKSDPYNLRVGRASGLLEVKQEYCAADIGNITVVGEGTFLSIDDVSVLSFDLHDHQLLVSLKLYDESGNLLIEIEKNEWISGDPLPWDIEADWQKLTLREKARKISLSLDAKSIPTRVTGSFWWKDKRIFADANGLHFESGKSGRSTFSNLAFVGTRMNIDSEKMSFGPEPGAEAAIISWPNHRERLWKAKDAWIKIQKKKLSSA